MTLEQAIDRYTNNAKYERIHGSLQGCLDFRQVAEWLKDYKRLLEQQPCEDCISRQAALNSLIDNTHLDGYDLAEALDAIENKEKLPPVTPQQKYGKWIIVDDCEQFIAKCSECGRIEDSRMISNYPYCHCGAKMQESEDKE